MRIAMVVERFPPDVGGSGVRFREIAERLSRRHAVDIFTLGCRDAEDTTRGLRVHRYDPSRLPDVDSYSLNRIAGLSFSTFFHFLLRSYEIIDVDIWPMFPFFSAKIAQPRTPTVISWNVVWPFSVRRVASRASTFLAKRCSRLCTYNITVSNFARKMLIKHLNVNPEKLSVIPNGNEEAFLRARLKPKQGRIIFVGRLELQKRLDLVLAAFKIFKERVNDAELHIVGSGPLHPELLHASDKIAGVHLHMSIPAQNRNELVSMLSNSWVFVSASEFETYGMAISEASTVGLPVVTTRTAYNAAVDEIIKNELNGLVVEHNSPRAIADAFEKLYRNPELWENLSNNAKRLAVFHSWDEVANQIEAVYKDIAAGKLPIDKSGVAPARRFL